MRESLRDVQFDIPYSTFIFPLKAAGQNPSLELGTSCLGLCTELRDRLLSKGFSPEYIAPSEDVANHYALLVENGDLFLLDPALMQMDPINLSKCIRERKKLEYPAYPIIRGNQSKITVEYLGESKMGVRKIHRESPLTEMTVLEYVFDMSTRKSSAPPESHPNFVRGLGRKLVLRVLDHDGSLTAVAQLTRSRMRSLIRFDKDGQRSKKYDLSDSRFLEDIEEMAAIMGVGTHELIVHFDDADRALNFCKKNY